MIKKDQIYINTEGRRIKVVEDPLTPFGIHGSGKVGVVTLTPEGREIRFRRIEMSQLHESSFTRTGSLRKNGYILEQDP